MNHLAGLQDHQIKNKYGDAIERAAGKWGLSSYLLYSQISQESGFQAGIISKAGAVGLMQILPTTAPLIPGLWSLQMPIGPLTDPDINLNLGCALMRWLFNEASQYTGDKQAAYKIALACYLSGTSASHVKAVAQRGFTNEEQAYISSIINSGVNGGDWNEIVDVFPALKKGPSWEIGPITPLILIGVGLLLWKGSKK